MAQWVGHAINFGLVAGCFFDLLKWGRGPLPWDKERYYSKEFNFWKYARTQFKKNKIALKGPITTPVGSGFRSVNVLLRQSLDLFSCVRPCRSYAGAKSRYENIDLVIVRENTEDLYAGIEFQKDSDGAKSIMEDIKRISGKTIRPDSGISIKPISVYGTGRIVNSPGFL